MIDGTKECRAESWEQCKKEEAQKLFEKKLGLSNMKIKLSQHIDNSGKNKNHPRTTFCKVLSHDEKVLIFKKEINLKVAISILMKILVMTQ